MCCLFVQERLLDEVKVEEGEEGEVDENGVVISSKRVRHFYYFQIQLDMTVTMDSNSNILVIEKTKCFR